MDKPEPKLQPKPKIRHGDHVAIFFDEPRQRWRILADYYREGYEQGEMCVLVIREPAKEVVKHLKEAGFDAREAVKKGDLRIFEMLSTYLSDGRFVADFMLHNVANFIEDAKSMGYKGIRTAGEMSWLDNHAALRDEAAVYEGQVNGLGEIHPDFTGLCLYHMNEGSASVGRNALRTHPTYLYDGRLHNNPYFTSNGEVGLNEPHDELAESDGDLEKIKELLVKA